MATEKFFETRTEVFYRNSEDEITPIKIIVKSEKNVDRHTVPKTDKITIGDNGEEIETIESPLLSKKSLKVILKPYYRIIVNSPNVRLEKFPEIMSQIGVSKDTGTRNDDRYKLKITKEDDRLNFEEADDIARNWHRSLSKQNLLSKETKGILIGKVDACANIVARQEG